MTSAVMTSNQKLSSPEKLRKQAQSILSESKNPKKAWENLSKWAFRNPMALNIAIYEFLTVYGTDPSAAFMIPKIMIPKIMHKINTLPLKMIKPFNVMATPFNVMATPFNVMATPFNIYSHIHSLPIHDMQMRMHEHIPKQMELSIPLKQLRSESSNVKTARSTGHQILDSLIRAIRSHGRSDVPKGKKPKKKARAKPQRKQATKTIKKKQNAKRKSASKKTPPKQSRKKPQKGKKKEKAKNSKKKKQKRKDINVYFQSRP